MQILVQHFQCWCYSYPTSTCLTANTLTSARATSVLTHLIKNSLFIISLYDDKKLIGMGRIIGDNGISYAVTDIMVDKEYQGKGYGKLIMKEIDNYFSENTDEDCFIILITNLPADNLYSKFSFEYLPNSKCGMLRKQNK